MAQKLRIKIMHFKTGMMDMRTRIPSHKKRMVINVLVATVNMGEEAYFKFLLR
jgi:hypothetical protein